jgi:outer membrane protein OmpA-like peptidoglycan-associated protein/tetratricopeptide (TPR) repeat protein
VRNNSVFNLNYIKSKTTTMYLMFNSKSGFKATFVALFLTLTIFNSNAQTSEKEQVLARKANVKYSFYDYNKALPLFLELLKMDSTNFSYNYKAGVCYLKSNLETAKSVKYLEAARKGKAITDGASYDFFYYLGTAYHLTNKFDEAIEAYNLAKTFPNAVDSLLDQGITQCELGKKLMQAPSDAKVFVLGKNVNTIYPDYSPIMLSDNSALIFTSTRKGSTGDKKSIEGGDYYEDIYVSKNTVINTSGNSNVALPDFAKAKNIGSSINTKSNDALISTSADGRALIVYRKNKLFQSDIYNGKFGNPKRLKLPVLNKLDITPSLFFTTDGSTLYFVSSRPGGYGGKDIYKSIKQDDGKWGLPVNLGPVVNSSMDEESPFFDSETNTLYFSSQGHNSIGGYDVFKTKLTKDDNWLQPESMGYPINSGTDDIFYMYNRWDNTGYFSTMRADGVGNYDIYMVRFIQPIKVALYATYSGNLMPKNLKIKILGPEQKDSMQVSVNQKNEVTYKSNKQYKMLIPRYNSDSILDTLRFKTPESLSDFSAYQEINFEPVKNNKGLLIGYKTSVYNVFFDMEKEIEKTGLRKTQSFLAKFPFCRTIKPSMQIYAKDKLTKEEEYSAFVRSIKPDHKNFKIYSQTSYIDTSSFELIYKIQDSIAAAEEKTSAYLKTMDTNPQDASSVKNEKSKTANVNEIKEDNSNTKKQAELKAAEKNTKEDRGATVNTKSKTEDKKSESSSSEKAKVSSSNNNFGVIYFSPVSSEVDKKHEEEIMKAAEYMKQNKKALLEIRGYSDATGNEEFNTVLSEDRALAVKRMLMAQGIPSERMKAIGMGVEKNVETQKGETGNIRRVEFVVSKGKRNK